MKNLFFIFIFIFCGLTIQAQDCNAFIVEGKKFAAQGKYTEASNQYISALICDGDNAIKIAPLLRTVQDSINAQKEKLQIVVEKNYEVNSKVAQLLLGFTRDSIRFLKYENAWEYLMQAYKIDQQSDKRNAKFVKNIMAELVFFLYHSEKSRHLAERKKHILKVLNNAKEFGMPYITGDTTDYLGKLWKDLADDEGETYIEEKYFGKMIKIPAGSFYMGDTLHDFDNDTTRKQERPIHKVSLDAFEMGETEVTIWQYYLFCEATGFTNLIYPDNIKWDGSYPVSNVSWYDAMMYCKWLNERKGINNPPILYLGVKGYESDNKVDEKEAYNVNLYKANYDTLTKKWLGKGYRLPTEAEWEYAARAGGISRFANGKDSADIREMNYYSASSENKFSRKGQNNSSAMPVKSYSPNNWGLYEMSGNLWEWCFDGFQEDFYQICKDKNYEWNVVNLKPIESKNLRGGGRSSFDINCRISNRHWLYVRRKTDYYGFRILRMNI